MKTCIYLRKSRADEEAEKQGQFETLHRHKTTLLKIAKEKSLNIVDIKEDVYKRQAYISISSLVFILIYQKIFY